MKKAKDILLGFLLVSNLLLMGALLASNESADKPGKEDATTEATDSNVAPSQVKQDIVAVKIPDKVTFSGEAVPVEEADVRERLDRELLVNTYWHSNTLQLFKLASRTFPVIEPILEEQGVPDDFKYLALAESGLRNVVSPSNAAGVWQFLGSTGREYGLEVNSSVDERYHLEKATVAACKYLKKAHERFGSWTLAAASYNMGQPALDNRLDDQKVESYYDLYLNSETSRYVFRIIALKEIIGNPESYGFNLSDEDLYHETAYKVVEIDTTIDNLPEFALAQGTNYKKLKLLNPWMRRQYLPNKSRKVYDVKIPL